MNKGYKYEEKIFNLCNQYGIVPKDFVPPGPTPNKPDLILMIKNALYNVELKLNKNAQMGGSSVKYIDNKFSIIGDYKLSNSFIKRIEDKKLELDEFLGFLDKKCIPTTTTKENWIQAKEDGLIKKMNLNLTDSFNFMAQHYNNKDTYYVQIGGKGLYYLGKNPASLPVPELITDSYLQVRLLRGASNKRTGIVSVALRFQGKIKRIKKESNLNLEDIETLKLIKSLT